MLVYPSAFCICQGPMHWELLQRARATDNQLFVVTCSPARDNMSGYVAYGHSMVVNPWAQVQREAGEGCEFIVEEIGECSTIIRDLCKTDCFRFRSVSRRF